MLSPLNHHLTLQPFHFPPTSPTPRQVIMAEQTPDFVIDIGHLLQAVREGLQQHPAHAGAIRIIIESETGEPLHVVKFHAPCHPASKPTPLPRPRSASFGDLIAASTSVQQRNAPEQGLLLLKRCDEQQQRITELEQRLQEMQQELQQRTRPPSPAHSAPLSPASSTDNYSSGSGSSSDSPHRADEGEDGHGSNSSSIAMTDDADDAPSSSLPSLQASDNSISTVARKSERPKNNVDRWKPDCATSSSALSSSHSQRRTKRRRRRHLDDSDGEQSSCSDMQSKEVIDSTGENEDDNDTVEVAALVAKLREGYDVRQSVGLDPLSRESIASLRQQVLDEAGGLGASKTLGQITSIITTSTSLKMVGYYLRATLAHRLKANSQKCYKRLARDTLGLKSPTDIAAYPALYEFIQHHYPSLGSVPTEAWLENPIFTADMTWAEWKRYLTKKGRLIIDAALQQCKAATAPFQDWMQLGWVEVYDDDKLGGQGVRALRDIHMPTSKSKQAQRDLEASISVVAADLHCGSPECMSTKDATRETDPMYLVQLDRQRVLDARHHWLGKINHLPDRLCNLRLTSTGKLAQVKPIAAGEALSFDYGVDYWVYQLSGLELSEWSASSSVQSNRGALDLFRRMHDTVLDYTDLLRCEWVRRRPAAWSELEREVWMGNLSEYLEEREL